VIGGDIVGWMGCPNRRPTGECRAWRKSCPRQQRAWDWLRIWSTEIYFAIRKKFTLVFPEDLCACRLLSSLKIFICKNLCTEFSCADYGADFRSFTIKPAHAPVSPNKDELRWNAFLNGLCGDDGVW